MAEPLEITLLLQRIADGDKSANEELAPKIYEELRRLAARSLRGERPGHTLQTTELVNEAYVRLAGTEKAHWQGRQHFFALAAQIMRRILTDYARRRNASKRGGGVPHLPLDEKFVVSDEKCDLLTRLEPALERLAKINARAERVVELRFYGGMSEEEIAAVMGVSSRTVKRLWQFARAWLLGEMSA